MIDSARVLGFLDVAGTWDPTLMFVLGGAVGVTVVSFRFVLRRANPFFAPKFYLPGKDSIDRRLLVGASIFGVGWGISGYCRDQDFRRWRSSILESADLSDLTGSGLVELSLAEPSRQSQPEPGQPNQAIRRSCAAIIGGL